MLRGTRIATLAILWLAPVLLLLFGFHSNWRGTWATVGVPAEAVAFPDLRGITGALVTLHNHGDPLRANPGDPWNRPLNYPRVWLNLFSILGINGGNISIVGVAFCVIYLTCMSALILRCKRSMDALILLVAGLSLAPLYAIELGNTDLFIFSLVFLGGMTHSKALKSGAFFSATILKIYPLAAMSIEAVRRPRKERIAILVLITSAIAWFAWQWRDLNAIRHATPVSSTMAYGALSLKAQVGEQLGSLFGHQVAAGWIVILTCWLAGAGAVVAAWTNRSHLDESIRNSINGRLFSAFGAIYAFSFAIGSNWDYRLIFLLPTLPLVFEMARHSAHRKWAMAYIALVVVAENPLDLRYTYGIALSHVTTFFLFIIVIAMLTLQCKPILAESSIGHA